MTTFAQYRRPALAATLLAAMALLLLPHASRAALTAVGSPLSGPATLNSSDNLGYAGVNTNVLPNAEFPTGVAHTPHFGADTAIWNTALAAGQAAMPQGGQADRIRLEGCAVQAPGGPAPLTQIHFQTLTPVQGGGMKVDLTSQAFDVPVCGQNGAGGSTVTTYEPVNLCVNAGDYVDFNDEGGFVERFYRSGVPYEVLGAARGSALASFLKGGGTNDGAVLTPALTSPMEGWATSQGEELMLQVELGTGPDARYICPGGTKDAPPVLAPVRVSPQTDGVNSSRMVSVAIYCRPTGGCPGTATLVLPSTGTGAGKGVGHVRFALPGNHTSHVSIRISPKLMALIRAHHGVATRLVAVVGGQTFTQTVTVKIF